MRRFFCALSLLVVAAMPANALDLSAVLLNDDDSPMCQETEEQAITRLEKGTECPTIRLFTVGKAIRSALYQLYQDEPNLSGEEKDKRGTLALRLTGKSEVKLSPEDLVLIRKVVGKRYAPLAVTRLYRILDDQVK